MIPLRILIVAVCVLLSSTLLAQSVKVLFDNTKHETSGNADWIIDAQQPIPSPAQSGISASTPETYWLGAISAWGVDLVKHGFIVHTLTTTYGITYGNGGNPYDLSNYNVFIVCEPQNPFSVSEKQALQSFVQNGGGLFIVADHYGSDRDGDGWDSPRVWNDANAQSLFGIHFQVSGETDNNISEVATNVSGDSVIVGPAGTVTALSYHNGSTMVLSPGNNASVAGHVWMNGATHGLTKVMAATSSYGYGRVAAVGDSSPADDGTGESGHTVYNGWTETGATDNTLFLNMTLWLAKGSSPLPIQLATFTGQVMGQSIMLDWRTLSEVNNYGFYIQRKQTNDSTFTQLINGFVPGHGTTNVPQQYMFRDSTISIGSWQYRLKQVDLDGTAHYSDWIRVEILTDAKAETVAKAFSLAQNYPNPWNPSTTIRYALPSTLFVTLSVYNTLGQKVSRLVNAQQEAGYHNVVLHGDGFASGVYFYRLQAGDFVATKKLLLLR